MRVSIIVLAVGLGLCPWVAGADPAGDPVPGAAGVQQELLTPSACGPSPMRVRTTCDVGAGFLCVDTPPGGTTGDHLTLTGLIDRVNHRFAGLKVAVQQDQTKAVRELDVQAAVAADGRFHVTVPLSQLGSYTVVLQALRAQGNPVIERVGVSRVIAPQAGTAQVTVTPDPAVTDGRIVAPSVMLGIDLLPHCEQCDYLGSGTGGTRITVHNTMTVASGAAQRIERTTDLGADGKFSLCVPVGTGANHLDLYACNAATGFDLAQCARLSPIDFTGDDGSVRIVLDHPLPDQHSLFDQGTHATMPIRFRVEGLDERTACVQAVTLQWNRAEPVPICPDADGVYATTVQPVVGINVGVITAQGGHHVAKRSLTLGWGTVRSPWDARGVAVPDDQRWDRDTLTVGVRQQFMADVVRELLNHVARSDHVAEVIQQIVDAPASGSVPTPIPTETLHRAEAMGRIRAAIPHCSEGGGLSGVRLRLVEPPRIGNLEITRVAFSDDTMHLDVVADHLSVRVTIDRDADHDGVADGIAIPLKIAFERLALYPLIRLVRGGDPLVLLTAATTNCSYQDDDYCTARPAVMVPQNFVGDATTAGGFVICDHEGQSVTPDIAEGCAALNVVNAQTGLLSAQVLSAINEMLYCTGSSALTYLLREGARNLHVVAGCGAADPGSTDPGALTISVPSGDCADPANPWQGRRYDIPLGFDLVQSALHVGSAGMSARIASRVGHAAFFRRWTPAAPNARPGYVIEPEAPQIPHETGATGTRDLALGVSETLLNQLFFVLGIQGDVTRGTGPFDWDLHPQTFGRWGFDFTRACDEFSPQASGEETPPALCQLRPRVKEIFGSTLTTAEYFPPHQPLMLRLRGSRRLTPHVRFFRADVPDQIGDDGEILSRRAAQFLDLQIPDLELAIYALQTDPAAGLDAYGNPRLLLDAQGQPLIASMRPDVADPLAGPIVRSRLTLVLPLEVGALHPDPTNPSQLELTFRTNSALTQLVFAVAPGANSTIIPDTSLLANLREKLLAGVSRFASERDAIRIALPKHLVLPGPGADTLWSLLGLQTVRLAKDGLAIGIDPGQDFVTVGASVYLTQRLVIGGELLEWTIPEE